MSLYTYKCELVRVVDGDTIEVMADLGFKTYHKLMIRLDGINAAETRTKDLVEKEMGLMVKTWLESFLKDKDLVLTTTYKNTFNRWVGVIFANDINVCEKMLNENLVEKWEK